MLDQRKRLILKAIIQDYIFTAEPVGSRALVKRHSLGLSPATIRNEMADLEEMGYLEQPHTSAGRVPSHRGYRFYVNSLLEDTQLSQQELEQLEQILSSLDKAGSASPRQLTRLLSSLTSYISLLAEPSSSQQQIRHIDIIPVANFLASIIVVLNDGVVKHHTINLPQGLEHRQIKALTKFVNQKLQGIALKDIQGPLLQEITEDFADIALIQDVLTIVRYMMLAGEDNLVVDGATNLLEQPEFKDVEKVRNLLRALEQNDQVLRLLDRHTDELSIKIGAEIGLDIFSDCSLVVSAFSFQNRKLFLGFLGPARMDYGKAIGFLKWLRQYYEECGGKGNE